MWCQPVTRYSVGWSVLSEHTHARVCIPSSKKKAIVPFTSSSRAKYRHGLTTAVVHRTLKASRETRNTSRYIPRRQNILWSSCAIRSFTSKSEPPMVLYTVDTYKSITIIFFFYYFSKRLYYNNKMQLILTNIQKTLTAIYNFIWPETN